MYWILKLKHISHDISEEAYLLVPDKFSYSYLYVLIAQIQKIHSEGNFRTEDLSEQQVGYLLSELHGINKMANTDAEEKIACGSFIRQLDLFWNWEQAVVKFCFDELSRAKGETPYFFPHTTIDCHPAAIIIAALVKMDRERN